MNRYNPKIDIGLTNDQVNERIKDKLVNYDNNKLTKSYKSIFFENIFTLFNFVNLILGLLIFITGEYKNLLFLGVVFCNTFISLIQEIRAKKIIDSLTITTNNKVNVIRDSKSIDIKNTEIVLDDLIKYNLGNQVIVDSIILDGNVIVDESNITGESDNITKIKGDRLLSGSYIISGECIGKVECIGEENYVNVITKEAKYYKVKKSEIINTLNILIKFISISIIPLGLLLFYKQYLINDNINSSIINTVAALIGTIPEGLVLLTSSIFAVSSIRLANKNVLTQNLYCTDTLARIDTICLDKTGTITTGNMNIKEVINISKYDINEIMSNICNYMLIDNSTSKAIFKYYEKKDNYKFVNKVDFNSITKCSIYEFKEGTYIIGAAEYIKYNNKVDIDKYTKDYRTLLLGYNKDKIIDDKVTSNFEIIGIILIEDEIRDNAKETIEYLKKEDIRIKIISGDNINTVNNILNKIGLNDLKLYDMSKYNGEELTEIVNDYDVFGRVTPSGKKDILIALKNNGCKVAMTGDGVNDVLSLKEADSSITLASATDAARNVSELILLDNDFKSLPNIIKEGRRSINNLERSASLFLTKTGFSIILAFLFLFINIKYPFIPIQLTLISVLTIGIPSFILALEPNHDRVKGSFLKNILKKSLPASLSIVINVLTIILLSYIFSYSYETISTMSVLLVGFTGFVLLYKVCYPFNCLRTILYSLLSITFVINIVLLNKLYELVMINVYQVIIMIILFIFDIILFNILTELISKRVKE